MPELRAAIAALEPTAVAASFRGGVTVVVSVAGSDHELTAEDLLVSIAPLEGYGLEREGSHAVALELALDDELIRAGLAREIVHAIQQLRRERGPRDHRPRRARHSAATRRCSRPPASTRATSPARRWRWGSPSRSARIGRRLSRSTGLDPLVDLAASARAGPRRGRLTRTAGPRSSSWGRRR